MLLAAAIALSIPLHFEPNQGQAPAPARLVAAAPEYTLFLSDTAITMQFPHHGALTLHLPRARVEALDALPGRTNYYAGADRSGWRTNVANYERVSYIPFSLKAPIALFFPDPHASRRDHRIAEPRQRRYCSWHYVSYAASR